MEKYCNYCKLNLSVELFYKNKTTKTGYSEQCKSCNDAYQKHRYQTDPEFRLKRLAKWRKWNYKTKYNISIEDYDRMLAEQQNCCKICKKHVSLERQRFSVDHNHLTGEVRGLLCDDCNMRIGVLEDTAFRILAEKYLQSCKN